MASHTSKKKYFVLVTQTNMGNWIGGGEKTKLATGERREEESTHRPWGVQSPSGAREDALTRERSITRGVWGKEDGMRPVPFDIGAAGESMGGGAPKSSHKKVIDAAPPTDRRTRSMGLVDVVPQSISQSFCAMRDRRSDISRGIMSPVPRIDTRLTVAEVVLFCDRVLEDSPDTEDAVLANNLLEQLEDKMNLDEALAGIAQLNISQGGIGNAVLTSPAGKRLQQKVGQKRERGGGTPGSTPGPKIPRKLFIF